MEQEERPDVAVGKINVDDESELAARFGIMSIPILVVMENGEGKIKAVGGRDKDDFLIFLIKE